MNGIFNWNSMILGGRWVILPMLFLLFVKTTEGYTCQECNAYFQGRRGSSCDAPANRTNCAACLKVITKVKLHDGWLIRRTSSVETKYCARVANSQGLKEEGCYWQVNNGGYTQRCFCYSDGCNKAAQLHQTASLWTYAILSLGLSILIPQKL